MIGLRLKVEQLMAMRALEVVANVIIPRTSSRHFLKWGAGEWETRRNIREDSIGNSGAGRGNGLPQDPRASYLNDLE
jgi:hypothetical protein